MSKTHEIKTINPYFEAVLSGEKTFEIRLNDRSYQVGDFCLLREFVQDKEYFFGSQGHYTGRVVLIEITYVFQGGNFGLMEGWCVFSFKKTEKGL